MDGGDNCCSVDGCDRPGIYGMCWAHRKQLRRRGSLAPVRPYCRNPHERVRLASLEYGNVGTDVEADAEFERAKQRLRMAALRAARKRRNH